MSARTEALNIILENFSFTGLPHCIKAMSADIALKITGTVNLKASGDNTVISAKNIKITGDTLNLTGSNVGPSIAPPATVFAEYKIDINLREFSCIAGETSDFYIGQITGGARGTYAVECGELKLVSYDLTITGGTGPQPLLNTVWQECVNGGVGGDAIKANKVTIEGVMTGTITGGTGGKGGSQASIELADVEAFEAYIKNHPTENLTAGGGGGNGGRGAKQYGYGNKWYYGKNGTGGLGGYGGSVGGANGQNGSAGSWS